MVFGVSHSPTSLTLPIHKRISKLPNKHPQFRQVCKHVDGFERIENLEYLFKTSSCRRFSNLKQNRMNFSAVLSSSIEGLRVKVVDQFESVVWNKFSITSDIQVQIRTRLNCLERKSFSPGALSKFESFYVVQCFHQRITETMIFLKISPYIKLSFELIKGILNFHAASFNRESQVF